MSKETDLRSEKHTMSGNMPGPGPVKPTPWHPDNAMVGRSRPQATWRHPRREKASGTLRSCPVSLTGGTAAVYLLTGIQSAPRATACSPFNRCPVTTELSEGDTCPVLTWNASATLSTAASFHLGHECGGPRGKPLVLLEGTRNTRARGQEGQREPKQHKTHNSLHRMPSGKAGHQKKCGCRRRGESNSPC